MERLELPGLQGNSNPIIQRSDSGVTWDVGLTFIHDTSHLRLGPVLKLPVWDTGFVKEDPTVDPIWKDSDCRLINLKNSPSLTVVMDKRALPRIIRGIF